MLTTTATAELHDGRHRRQSGGTSAPTAALENGTSRASVRTRHSQPIGRYVVGLSSGRRVPAVRPRGRVLRGHKRRTEVGLGESIGAGILTIRVTLKNLATYVVRYNTRPGWRLAQAITNGSVCGLLSGAMLAALGGLAGFLLGLALGVCAGASLSVVRTGRRCLIVNDEGLTAVRNGYSMCAKWDDLVSFEAKRFAGVLPVETILVKRSDIFGPNGAAVPDRLQRKIEKAAADRRVQVGVYIKDRRYGQFAEMLALHRPDLAGSA